MYTLRRVPSPSSFTRLPRAEFGPPRLRRPPASLDPDTFSFGDRAPARAVVLGPWLARTSPSSSWGDPESMGDRFADPHGGEAQDDREDDVQRGMEHHAVPHESHGLEAEGRERREAPENP